MSGVRNVCKIIRRVKLDVLIDDVAQPILMLISWFSFWFQAVSSPVPTYQCTSKMLHIILSPNPSLTTPIFHILRPPNMSLSPESISQVYLMDQGYLNCPYHLYVIFHSRLWTLFPPTLSILLHLSIPKASASISSSSNFSVL